MFRILFPKSTLAALLTTNKNNSVILKTYNQSDIKQLGVCTVRLRHKDENAKCRFLLVPGDDPALLGMPDIKLLNTLKIMCEMIGDTHESRKFDSQTIGPSNGPSFRANKTPQIKTDKADANNTNANMQDYFGSSINRAADIKAS